jgi:hypothetical protein
MTKVFYENIIKLGIFRVISRKKRISPNDLFICHKCGKGQAFPKYMPLAKLRQTIASQEPVLG